MNSFNSSDIVQVQPPAPAQMTQRDCAIMGTKFYAVGAIIVVLLHLVVKLYVVPTYMVGYLDELRLPDLVLFAYILVPLAAITGAVVNYRLYRVAVNKAVPAISIWAGFMAFMFLTWFVVLFYVAHRLRRDVLEKETPRLSFAWVYLVIVVAVCIGTVLSRDHTVVWALAYAVVAACFLCDILLVNALLTLRREGRLAPPASEKFQFSLGTMMFIVVAVGAWVTGLVAIFQQR